MSAVSVELNIGYSSSPHDSATKQLPCLDCELYFSYIAFLSSVGCTAEPGEPQKTLCLRNRDVAATGHAICRHSPQASTASPLLCWHCSVRSCLCVLLIHNKVTSPSDCMRRIARAFMSEQRARHWTSSKPSLAKRHESVLLRCSHHCACDASRVI